MDRTPTHAGSWYPANKDQLIKQLQNSKTYPSIPNCKIIISPHAGYKYCSSTMLPAYNSLDITQKEQQKLKFFILGPSHHIYFKDKILLSKFNNILTPLGPLSLDTELISNWIEQYPSIFKYMDPETDQEEHSLEMQYPILYHTLQSRGVQNISDSVEIIPMLISHGSDKTFNTIGRILSDIIVQDNSYIVVSSDFCHWGKRFDYTGYVGSREDLQLAMDDETEIEMLTSRSKLSHHQIPIAASIEILDKYGMDILNLMDPAEWKKYLDITGNTICGRMPLEILLYTLNLLKQGAEYKINWSWNKYSQSSQVQSVGESSVSYSSGHITLKKKK